MLSFNCEEKKWYPWNSDSYWDLYESEYMLTVMRSFSPEKAVEILENMNAFVKCELTIEIGKHYILCNAGKGDS